MLLMTLSNAATNSSLLLAVKYSPPPCVAALLIRGLLVTSVSAKPTIYVVILFFQGVPSDPSVRSGLKSISYIARVTSSTISLPSK